MLIFIRGDYMPYEYHKYDEDDLKIIFHSEKLYDYEEIEIHWHKSPELLLVTNGILSVKCDGNEEIYNCGEIAVINGNQIHDISSVNEFVEYHCLIVDTSISGKIGRLPIKSNNALAKELYLNIVKELTLKKLNFKEAVIGYCKALLAVLSRELPEEEKNEYQISNKIEIVRSATQFIFENFHKEISLKEISDSLGISKYYLSHIFKEATGKTVLNHLNLVRCNNAKSLLESGKYNVAQSAYASGFSNLSYFSKTYKKLIGNLPVKDLKLKK